MNNQPFAYPLRPANRAEDIKEALQRLRLGVGGGVATRWERFCRFIILFPDDGLLNELPANHQDLVNIARDAGNEAAVIHLRQQHTEDELIHLLQGRIPLDALIKSINRRNGYSQLTRPELIQTVIAIHKGAPIRDGENLPATLVTLANFINGKFDEQSFLDGNSTWQVKQGNATAAFNAKTVLRAYQAKPNIPVLVNNGLFAGKIFPTPAQCVTIYQTLTHRQGTLAGEEVPLWIYQNLGSSSFFNDLFEAAWFFLTPQPAAQICPMCDQQP